MRRVVITGLGIVSPLSSTVDGTWTKILKGCSGANKITRFNTDGYTFDGNLSTENELVFTR